MDLTLFTSIKVKNKSINYFQKLATYFAFDMYSWGKIILKDFKGLFESLEEKGGDGFERTILEEKIEKFIKKLRDFFFLKNTRN